MFYSGKKIGNYTLVKVLGQGSFGEVWLATRQTKFITTKVAVKLPHSGQVNSESIKQEAVLWEQASGHPNVLPIIEADECEGQILIVSEYAADGTLSDLLDKRGYLPVKQAVEIGIGILNGLEFLHSRHIIHRDIKPANILLQGNIPRLTDFGLSRATSGNSLSMSISVNGTPYYMAPEAFNRKRNKQTDIWSFGVVLYKMLTGKLPFAGGDLGEVYASVFTKEPAPMSEHIPLEVRQIVRKCLNKNPLERYQEAADVREDLLSCQSLISLKNTQPQYLSESSDFEPEVETAEPFSLVVETKENVKVENTNHSSRSAPRKNRNYLKYAVAASLLFLSVFATGFYIISRRSPIPFRQGDKFGYSTWAKQMVIGTKYDRAFPFRDNLALVAVGAVTNDKTFAGKYGFIDKNGREVIPLQYDDAAGFANGLAKVGKFDAAANKILYGFVNRSGGEEIPLTYDDAKSFSESLAIVKRQGKWGAVSEKGSLQIPFKYDSLRDFSHDLAAFEINGKYGFVDKNGTEVIPAVYDFAGEFSDKSAPVQKDGKAFFIDKSGRELFAYKYEAASTFSEGFAFVKQNGKAGFISEDGTEAVHFQYENDSTSFSEGLANVRQNGKYGFINKGGKVVLPFKYASADSFDNNLALVKSSDGKEFYIGYDGTEFYQP